jgi:large subunit ribosomal protein L4e
MEDSTQVTDKKVVLPGVFQSAIRLDIVQFVHANLSKNARQAHGVDPKAGMRHSAASWGTGRAVARIPRISGSGTSRSGQAAFGNMVRAGRMSFPLKTYRRWHRKVNLKQRRHAVAVALAATALAPLVQARGHRISNVPELPLVVEDRLESIQKTSQAVTFLKQFGAYEDVQKVVDSKTIRAGKGKLRNKRYQQKKGPLVVYANENVGLVKAFRNVPGVEVINVNRLSLKALAPGGQLGRFVIYTQSAIQALDSIFGSSRKAASLKKGYNMLKPVLNNADVSRLINSNEIQSVVNPVKTNFVAHYKQKKNALTNKAHMNELNPNAEATRKAARVTHEKNQ